MTATPDPARDLGEFLENLPDGFLYCRELGHNWRAHTASFSRKAGTYERTLRCPRCKTLRVQELSARGHVISNRYDYADGYTSKGIGRLVGDDRDALRLTSLQRFTTSIEAKQGKSA